jgi:ketosteroid isomerase-like protein
MPRDKLRVAKRAADVYNSRDIDTFFAECATADIEWWPALQRAYGADCYRGREGVETFLADTWENWEELQWVAEEYRDLGDFVLAAGRLYGRGKESGARVDAPAWNVLDFRDGRIWRSRVYFDRAEAFRAAGVSE